LLLLTDLMHVKGA